MGEVVRIFSCNSPGARRWQFITYERFASAAAAEVDRAAVGDAFATLPIEHLLWLVGEPKDMPPPYARDAAGRLRGFLGQLEDEVRALGLLDRMEDTVRRLEARAGEKWKPPPPDDHGQPGKPGQGWLPQPGAVVFLRK